MTNSHEKNMKYIQKLPHLNELKNKSGLKTEVKSIVIPAEDYEIAIKLFDMAHGISVDKLIADEFIIVKRDEFREFIRGAQ